MDANSANHRLCLLKPEHRFNDPEGGEFEGVGVDARRGYSAVEEEEEWELMRGGDTVLWKKKRSGS